MADHYIHIGINTDNISKVGKELTTELSPTTGVLISPKSKLDLLNPTFEIQYNESYLTCNYVDATSFLGRKYFAKCATEPGGRMLIMCTVDPLSSFDLSKCPVTVLRNGGVGAPTKMQDTKFPVIPNEQEIEQTVSVNNGLSPDGQACYVVTVIGGPIT